MAKPNKKVEYIPVGEELSLPEVKKTPQMVAIENDHEGRDIRLIIRDLYNNLGSQKKVAEALGLEQSTVTIWALRLGIEFSLQPLARIRTI